MWEHFNLLKKIVLCDIILTEASVPSVFRFADHILAVLVSSHSESKIKRVYKNSFFTVCNIETDQKTTISDLPQILIGGLLENMSNIVSSKCYPFSLQPDYEVLSHFKLFDPTEFIL